ncbi:retinol dehydrogenase 13-like [Caretta caretta]|uniref:retinol dehydrogenase 13-like n=1 Tax=Caretta caretta TaxID=8467 RepID=UPI0020950D1C|nr:retinol dehydrogenase 13-like [Caretta caretta]
MEISCFSSHLGWATCVLVLALLLRARRKGSWHPRMSPTDLTGKTAIVTGANCGIGKYVALDLAHRNARTILACSSRERGQAAAEEIQRATGNPNVPLRIVDLSNMASIRRFAKQIQQEEKRLDILVNNAGVSGLPFSITSEGLEQTFATNYLGPFLLTNLLLDTMKASAPARIVNVSSFVHFQGMVNMKHLTGEERTKNFHQTYRNTKLMNVLFTKELARRLQGTGVTANSLNPGIVKTQIMRHFNWLVRLLFSIAGIFLMSAEEGAASTIYCAVSEEVAGVTGKYFDSDCRLMLPSAAARDPGLARKLWEESERRTGLAESRGM